MDPLSHIITLVRPHAALSKTISGRGEWGVRYAAYQQPGFALILSGQCWLEIESKEPIRLDRGDFVLLPSTPAFALSSRPGIACVEGSPSDRPVRHGDAGGEADFEMLGGAFRIDPVNAPLLCDLLPGMIHICSAENAARRITAIIDLIIGECAADGAGRDMVLARLLEVMMIECLRSREIGGDPLSTGLLAAMRDPALARALRAIHADIRAGWTVAGLGRLAGMSRSAFAARFTAMLGCPPMEYVSRWRMALAQDALSRGGTSLDRLAEEIGYESASAFSTAFRRRVGCSPGMFARACRARDEHIMTGVGLAN